MSRQLRGSFLIAIFVGVFGTLGVQAQSPLTVILQKMDNYNKSLQSLHASVSMTKHNAQLNIDDPTLVGTTTYLLQKKRYARIDWERPVQESIVIIGDHYELYRPRLNQVIEGQVDKAKGSPAAGGALAFMNMSRDQLRSNYDVTYMGEEIIKGGVGTVHLLLKPKANQSFKSAELWIDANGVPLQAKIVEPNNDYTVVVLENLAKNLTINASIFSLGKLPRNVKRVAA